MPLPKIFNRKSAVIAVIGALVLIFQNCSGGFKAGSGLGNLNLGSTPPAPGTCVNPNSSQSMNVNAEFISYSLQTGTTQAQCEAARVVSVCQASGALNPTPPIPRYTSCLVDTAPPSAWAVPSISFTVGSNASFDLKTTLPQGTTSGGVFDIDAASPPLPPGMQLDKGTGIVSLGTAAVGVVDNVIFTYESN